MHITRLAVKGFRSLRDVVWEPGKLNVLIGPNGGGKSNVLKVIELLSAAAQGQLSKYIQHEGGLEALLWDGRGDSIDIECLVGHELPSLFVRESFRYWLVLNKRLFATYRIESEELESIEPERKMLLSRDYLTEGEISPTAEDLSKMETLLSFTTPFTSPTVKEAVSIWHVKQSVTDWTVYSWLDTSRGSPLRQPGIVSFDKLVSSTGENLTPVLHTAYETNREFKREINRAMKAAFGDDFDELTFPPAADHSVQLRVRWKSLKREQSAADLPDGVLRFLFLLTVLANPGKQSVIAIDEPETGLHPSMIPVVADYVAEAAGQAQIVLTTHSPALLDALGKLDPTITVVEIRDGATKLKNMSSEELKYWLDQFTLGQVYRSGQLESLG